MIRHLRTILTTAAILMAGLFSFTANAEASPAAPAPVCQIVGIITNIKEREEPYQNDSWRKSMNLPKSITYTDVTIHVTEESLIESAGNPEHECTANNLPDKRTYQLREKEIKLEENQKIQAHTKFSGDEFAIGNWLYNITPLDETRD